MAMTGSELAALRRERMARAPAILRGGFRPFFLGGAVWAMIALALWLLALTQGYEPSSVFSALAWHRHEMLFGFVGAVVSGFLLTAIPNWTGRLPIAGGPLAALFGLWLAGRIVPLLGLDIGRVLPALLDGGFYLVLAALAAREVIAAGNRNVPIVLVVALFGFADLADHAVAAGLIADSAIGVRAAIALIVALISLVGGRIIPSFTRNWLAKHRPDGAMPGQPTAFDKAVLAATVLTMLGYVVLADSPLLGWALVAVAALQAVRLARWQGLRCVADPLVLVLHVGYAWIPIGLGLLGAAMVGSAVPPSAAIHALTAGAMGTMILAVMTRATLGHTGRALHANGWTVAIYASVTIGALLRVFASLQMIDYTIGMHSSAVAWGAAFGLFVLAYGPILAGPRNDGGLT